MRLLAKRTDDVWLLTEEDADPPAFVRVLDRSIGRLYPPHSREDVLKEGDWEDVPKDAPDADAMLVGVEVMPPDSPVPRARRSFL